MSELSLNRSKNMYKSHAKKEAEKQVGIPNNIIEAELYDFNVKLEILIQVMKQKLFIFNLKAN